MAEHDEDPLIGELINGCLVSRRIGVGSHSVVYEVKNQDGQRYALKILRAGDPVSMQRFLREAQVLAQVDHPSLVSVHNVGRAGAYNFLQMEFVPGESLEAAVEREGPLPWQAAASMGAEVASALAHLHEKGMVHRDVGPQHLLLCGESVRVIGFHYAKHVHSSASAQLAPGELVGTPNWISPEQAGGKPTDARADIYSLGATLYYLTTGIRPFTGKNVQELFLKHFFYAPESPATYQPGLPPELCSVIQRCLKKKKLERYQDATELAQDLRAVPGL